MVVIRGQYRIIVHIVQHGAMHSEGLAIPRDFRHQLKVSISENQSFSLSLTKLFLESDLEQTELTESPVPVDHNCPVC